MTRQPNYYRRKKDANHNSIKEAIERAGHYVTDTHRQGFGFPDMLVVTRQRCKIALVEIKQPNEDLTPQEKRFAKEYPGTIFIFTDPQEAVDVLYFWDETEE